MVIIDEMIRYRRTIRSIDRSLLNQMLDNVRVAAFFETSDKKSTMYAFGQKKLWSKMPDKTNSIVFGASSFDDQLEAGIMKGFWFEPEFLVVLQDNQLLSSTTAIDDYLEQFNQSKELEAPQIIDESSEPDWQARVQNLINELRINRSLKKVVFSRQQQVTLSSALVLSKIIPALQKQQDVYHVAIKRDTELFITATPERLVKINNKQVETAAVAGTIRRGQIDLEDVKLGKELLNSEKNNQEHRYVVDNIVQQLGSLTTQLHVPSKPLLLKNKQVQHLYTPIQGTLAINVSIKDVVQKLHPTPALGGLPKKDALAYIRHYELHPRGLFASPIGYFTKNSFGEFVVGIRSMYVNGRNACLFAGAGIVAESDSQQELRETTLKFQPMLELLEELSNDGYTNF
ncbi:isochorismate synthase [Leuconostoc mesenteroides]